MQRTPLSEDGDVGVKGEPGLFARVPLPPWDMYTVTVCLVTGYILVPLLVTQVLLLIDPFIDTAWQLLVQQSVTLLTWGAIFSGLAWRYRISIWPYLGVRFDRPRGYYFRETLRVLVAMLGLMLLLTLWMNLTGTVPSQPYAKYDSQALRIITLFAIMTAPVLEELVFRGFVQSTFHKVSPPVRTVIFTCLTFLLFHPNYFTNTQAMLHVLVLGLLLGYWRERTQSIIPGVLGHTFNNLLASVALWR